jgi:secretion/DNA translocation related TadE-like protein
MLANATDVPQPGVREFGAATLWLLGLALLPLTAAGLAAGVVEARVIRHRAESVADLAALAGAAAARAGAVGTPGSAPACDRAAAVVAASGGVLLSCATDPGREVVVRVRVPARLPVVGSIAADAVARAGPPQPPAP